MSLIIDCKPEDKYIDDNGVETTATLVKGQSYYREAGVSHNVINNGKEKLVFIEIELKDHAL